MKIHENAVISNWCALNNKRDSIIDMYKSDYDLFCNTWSKSKKTKGTNDSKCDFCIWIKSCYKSNVEFMELMKLQTIDLRYIAVTEIFDWDRFIHDCDNNVCDAYDFNEIKVVCNICDMDRTLHLLFNTNIYGEDDIKGILSDWETTVSQYINASIYKRVLSNEVLKGHRIIPKVSLLYK